MNRITGEVIFEPPKNEEVPRLIKNIVNWINSPQANELDHVIEAGIFHYEFVRINRDCILGTSVSKD